MLNSLAVELPDSTRWSP